MMEESNNNLVQQPMDPTELTRKLLIIGKEHGLNIEQTGKIENLVGRVMSGALHPNDFVGELEDALGLESEQSVAIATEINIEIFLPIREALMESHAAAQEAPVQEPVQDPTLSRDSILAEIENPTPVEHPISAAQEANAPAIPRPQEITEVAPKPIPPAETKEAQEKAAQDFIGEKLSTPTSAPPKRYEADPYREPLA